MDQALLDEDADNVFVLFVQDPHDVGYGKPVIDEEIANGDFPFRDWVQGCRIPWVRKYLCGDTEAVSFQRFGQCHGNLPLKLIGNRENRKERSRKWEEVRRNREPAGMEGSRKTPHCMRAQEDFRIFRRARTFLEKSMKRNDASTRL
jgi:hypothetical protein